MRRLITRTVRGAEHRTLTSAPLSAAGHSVRPSHLLVFVQRVRVLAQKLLGNVARAAGANTCTAMGCGSAFAAAPHFCEHDPDMQVQIETWWRSRVAVIKVCGPSCPCPVRCPRLRAPHLGLSHATPEERFKEGQGGSAYLDVDRPGVRGRGRESGWVSIVMPGADAERRTRIFK